MQDGGGGDGGGGGGDFGNSTPVDTTPAADVPAAPDPAPAPVDTNPAPSSGGEVTPVIVATQENKKDPRSLLTKALEALQVGKRKKLDKVLALAQQKRTITNDDVQLVLRVSDATATRYLNQLVKEGKLKMSGIRGGAVYELA